MAARSTLSRIARRSAAVAVLAVAALAAPAQAGLIGPDPHSPNAEDISIAYWVMLVVAVALFLGVNAALVAAVVRFRAQRGRRAGRVTAGRGSVGRVAGAIGTLALVIFVFGVVVTSAVREVEPSGDAGLEAAAARTAQVGIAGVPAADPLEGEEAPPEEPPTGQQTDDVAPLEIDGIGQQWLWRFEYPGGEPGQRTFTYSRLVVPVDTTVVLNITSTDVLHSWFVPSLGGQVQAVPGTVSQTWFKADEEGLYEGGSTAFSGAAYPTMEGSVEVVSPTAYEDFLTTLEDDLADAQSTVQQAAGGSSDTATEEAP